MKKVKLTYIIYAIVALLSCSNTQFEKRAWEYRDDLGEYPNRKKMLKDLLQNHKLKGLTYKELIKTIGSNDNFKNGNSGLIYYNIEEDYGTDIDPVYIKNLVFIFNNDSIVADYRIQKWRK